MKKSRKQAAATSSPPRQEKRTSQPPAENEAPAAMSNWWQSPRADWLVVVVAMVVRLIYWLEIGATPLVTDLRGDHYYYWTWGERIAAGQWLGSDVFEQGPLYAYFLAVGMRLTGSSVLAILFFQLLLGVATCWLTFRCGKELFGPAVGITAGILAAVYGPLVFYDVMVMKSFLSPLLTMLALWGSIRFTQNLQLRWLIVAGSAVGLACLVRENHILLLLPAAAAVLLAERKPDRSWRQAGTAVAVLFVSYGCCLLPSTVHNWLAAKQLVAVTSGGGEVFYMAWGPSATPYYNPPPFVLSQPGREHEDFREEAIRRTGQTLSRREASSYWSGQARSYAWSHPLRTATLVGLKGLTAANDFEVPDSEDYLVWKRFVPPLRWLPSWGMVFGLALLGLILALRQPLRNLLPLGFFAAHAVSLILIYNFGRFRLGLTPLLLLLAALGLVSLISAGREWWQQRTGWGRCLLFVAIVVAGTIIAWLPVTPPFFAVGEHVLAAKVAIAMQRWPLAEQELQQALQMLPPADEPQSTTTNSDASETRAAAQALLAEVLFRTGRTAEALAQWQQARNLPQRPDLATAQLSQALGMMMEGLAREETASLQQQLRTQIAATLQKLRELKPEHLPFVALSIAYDHEYATAADVRQKLEQAQSAESEFSSAERTWWSEWAQAFLAAQADDRSAVAVHVRQALVASPDHPLAGELKKLVAEVPK